MRTLEYKVTGQLIEPIGDHSRIYAGTRRYLQLSFELSEDWRGCTIIAVFGDDYAEIVRGRTIILPDHCCDGSFRFCLIGARGDYRIKTHEYTERMEVMV